jgi:hypothetical protein
MKLYVFTKKDIDRFLVECNFTPDEERLFRLRCKEHTLEYRAEQMNVSISTAKRLSRRVNNKIIKVCLKYGEDISTLSFSYFSQSSKTARSNSCLT